MSFPAVLCCHGDSQLKIVQAQVKASMCADTGNAPAGLEPIIGSTGCSPRMGCSLLSECPSTGHCGDFQMEIEMGRMHPREGCQLAEGPDYGDSLLLQPPCLPLFLHEPSPCATTAPVASLPLDSYGDLWSTFAPITSPAASIVPDL